MSMKSKGLSSVVGAVLLMLISVGAAASAWTFIDTVTQSTQDNVENRIDEREDEANSELSSDIAYNSSQGYIIITIRNTGSNTLLIRDDEKRLNMYVRGRPVSDTDGAKGWTYLNTEKDALQPKESVTLNTTHEFPPEGEDYSIEVIGPSDTSTTYICYNSGTASC